jgi:hypothetical protein
MIDGTREPLRVRAYYVRDADIDYITKHFTPTRLSEPQRENSDGRFALCDSDLDRVANARDGLGN